MLALLKDIIEAHGGVKKWNQFSIVSAEMVCGGKLFEQTTLRRNPSPRLITVWLHEQRFETSHWDPPDRGYFNGDALWIYLTTPFFMLLPGVEVRETEPWQEGDETWNGLSVTFPSYMSTHSSVQNFYFGKDNLIRRNDYQLAIAGDFHVAQYISGLTNVQGILVPSRRRAYKRNIDGKPLKEKLMVRIDLKNIRFS